MIHDKLLRKQLVDLLTKAEAHVNFAKAVAGIPSALRGLRPAGAEHSPWELVEHMRIALWDILEFSRDANHKSPDWPTEYWPTTEAPPSEAAWDESIKSFHRDLEGLCNLVMADSTDLLAKIPHGDGQTVLREAMLAADHNAYHVGQLILVRQLLGAWQ